MVDARTVRRWLSGENLPNPVTALRMRSLLNGTRYVQADQTLDDGTKSYGVLLRRDEASDADIDYFVRRSRARFEAKREHANKRRRSK